MSQDIFGDAMLAVEQSRARHSFEAGFPYFFSRLFGSGELGDLTAVNQTAVGYLGAFGAKQYNNLTIAAGVTWTVATGDSNGALMLAVKGKLSIGGSIVANGANGGNGAASPSGTGGATAGGGVGAGGVTSANHAIGSPGTVATKYGHGVKNYSASLHTAGGGSGAINTGVGTAGNDAGGGALDQLTTNSGSTYSNRAAFKRSLQYSAAFLNFHPDGGVVTVAGTAATNGTSPAVRPSTADIGPWAQVSGTGFLSLDYIPPGVPGAGGGTTGDGAHAVTGGGGGGGGGVIIIECETLELLAGYAITANGGNGGTAFSAGAGASGMGGGAGSGGIIIIICRKIIGSTAAITANAGSVGVGAQGGSSGLVGLAGGVYIIQV